MTEHHSPQQTRGQSLEWLNEEMDGPHTQQTPQSTSADNNGWEEIVELPLVSEKERIFLEVVDDASSSVDLEQ